MQPVPRDRSILAGVIFVTLLGQVVLYPGVAELVAALGATTDLDASMWFLAVEFAAFIAFAGVWGLVSDRTGRRVPFIAVGAALAATCLLGLAIAGQLTDLTFSTVLAIRLLQGIGGIGAFSLAITMLMDLGGGHGRNMGAAGIAIGSGTALGAPVGGALASAHPLAPLGLAGGLFLCIVPLVALVTDRAPRSDRPTVARVLGDLRAHPALTVPFAFGFIDRLTAGTFSLVGVFFFRELFGLSPAQIGLMLMLFFAPFALLQYPMGMVSDRIGRFVPVVGGSLCYGAGVMAVGQSPTLFAAGLLLVLVGVFGALVAPATMALVTDIIPARRRATAMAGFNVAGSIGFLTGIIAGGLLADAYGFAVAFAVVGSLEVLIALAAIPAFRRYGIGAPTPTA